MFEYITEIDFAVLDFIAEHIRCAFLDYVMPVITLLAENGVGMVEINEALGRETAELFRTAGFTAEVVKDLSDKDRFVRFFR